MERENLKEKIRYTKTGKRIETYEFEGRLHQKIILEKEQFYNHIKAKHPEITLEIIEEVLEDPDHVTKQSKSRKEHYYQKQIENMNYFIVVSDYRNIKNYRFIQTAFSINNLDFLKEKNIHYMSNFFHFYKSDNIRYVYILKNKKLKSLFL